MKKHLIYSLSVLLLSSHALAQRSANLDADCDPETQDCEGEGRIMEPHKGIYPYKPFETSYIKQRLEKLTENSNFLWDIREMERRGLNKAKTKVQPWGGSFWPLNQGMVGNNYHDRDYTTFIFDIREHLSWRKNVKDYRKRAEKVHPAIYELDEKELAKLSPSEKYDILLGDTSFDLTNRVWNYAEKWGEEKRWGFLSAIELPEGYRVPDANKMMALWEGICHGWTVAAGTAPRPERTVWVTLPNSKRMPFYPNDIKALLSLMFAHSTIQDNVIFEGNRCNKKRPDKDKHGRYIDTKKDKFDTELLPRCADVHPAIFHVATTNIVGIDGRSFVVDHNPTAPIANQPVSGYEIEYFNPKTGKEGPLRKSIISVAEYGDKDPFRESRNAETTHIVGATMKLSYVDWELPKKKETNSVADDKITDFDFDYDLELNAVGKIVGGQWRVKRKGGRGLFANSTDQPDFFWVVPKNWKEYVKPVPGLPQWNFRASSLPPKEYLPAAQIAHGFVYEESKKYWGVSPKCPVFPINGEGAPLMVDCEFRYPRPQPLIQVVDKLLEMSRN